MEDLKDKLKMTRKDRVKKLLEKIHSGEYATEAREDANDYIGDMYDSMEDEEKEEFAAKDKERRKKRNYGN